LHDSAKDVRDRQSKLHLIGLCSEGGVHSHLDHLLGLLDLAKLKGLGNVCVHAITDGRDTRTTEGVNALTTIQNHIDKIGIGRISTLSGRYFAMDRDRRWDRVKKAYDVITDIDATQSPVDVLGKIVSVLVEDRRNHFGEEGFSAVT